jgi:DASS family divalent anion:Na+ symporter
MSRHARMLAPVAVGAAIALIPVPAGVQPQGWRLLAVFAATIVGMMVQVLETGAVVLLGLVAAILTGAMTTTAVLGGFSNSIVWLIVSAFLFSQAVSDSGLGKRIAFWFIRMFGRTALGLGYALAASELVIAPAVPANTARTGAILYPVVSSIARVCCGRRLAGFLMLNQFHATIILSAMFLTATTTNPLAVELAEKTAGVRIGWGLWAAAAAAPGIVSLLFTTWMIYRLHRPESADSREAAREAGRQLAAMGPMTRSERVLAGIVAACLALWCTGQWHRLDPTTVALAGLACMLLGRVMTWQDVMQTRGAWDAFVWFGGLIGMADWLGRLGLTAWLAGSVGGYVQGQWLWILFILSLVYFYSHYAFASMTAHVTAMYAPFLAVAVTAGAPALPAALILGFLSTLNAAMTHYSTGPAPIYFGAGYVDVRVWWKVGFVVSVAHLLIWLGLGGVWWRVLRIW